VVVCEVVVPELAALFDVEVVDVEDLVLAAAVVVPLTV
jgi:hypothetical protein